RPQLARHPSLVDESLYRPAERTPLPALVEPLDLLCDRQQSLAVDELARGPRLARDRDRSRFDPTLERLSADAEAGRSPVLRYPDAQSPPKLADDLRESTAFDRVVDARQHSSERDDLLDLVHDRMVLDLYQS